MPDIFGLLPTDYEIYRDLQEAGEWEAYQQGNAELRRASFPYHDFEALGGGVPQGYERATEDAQAVGYVTNNLLAIQTFVDEVLYTRFRLPEFIHLNTGVPDGAQSYGVRVRNRVGQAQRITAPGYDAPSATTSQSLVTTPIEWYGLDGEWSLDELRGAQFAGHALDTETIDAAVTGTMETMEAVGLTGGDYAEKGLLNQPYGNQGQAAQRVTQRALDDAERFSAANQTAQGIRSIINQALSKVISDSKETIGMTIAEGLTIYLPGFEYDLLTDIYIGDNADKTLMRSIIEDNPWTHFSGQPIMFKRVIELENAGASNNQRMVITLKNSRICEMGVSIMPRVLRIMDKGRVICALVEAKFSSLFVKRPKQIYYIDNINANRP